MATHGQTAKDELNNMASQNPAEPASNIALPPQRKRIPMTVPMRKLEVSEIPGYHLQWIKGTQERIQQALNAAFEFVTPEEVGLNNLDLGGDARTSGNTDMGSRVSCGEGSGETTPDGQSIRLYLMKQRKEYRDEDMQFIQARNDAVVDSLTAQYRSGMVGTDSGDAPPETTSDRQQRYVGAQSKIPELFRRKPNRSQ